MAKTLLDILNGPYPKVEQRTPNEKGMTPLPQETGARAFLKSLKVAAHPDPYGNDDSFSAKDVSVFQRAKNRYGYDTSTQGSYNDQGSPKDHVLRNPTINVTTEAFVAVDSIGLGSKTAWRVVNKYTNEYVTRIMQKEDAIAVANDLNRSFIKELLQEVDELEEERIDKIKKKKITGYGMTWDKNGNRRIVKSKAAFNKIRNKGHYTADKPYQEEIENIDESVTRKHFRDVANTVRSIEDWKERQKFADHHAAIFARQNPRFDHEKFHQAAGTFYDGKSVGSKPWREEIELDEISRSKADYYIDRATRERAEGRNKHKVAKREKGVSRAMNKIYGRVGTKVHATEENLNELSKKAHGRYQWVAGHEIMDREKKLPSDIERATDAEHENAIKLFKRQRGIDRSNRLLNRKHRNNEETELTEAPKKLVLNYAGMKREVLAAQRKAKKPKNKINKQLLGSKGVVSKEETDLTETLSAGASAKDYIHDFVHSKNKMFKGDSKKEKIRRALGAYYHHKEETRSLGDVLNELSKKTLKSYYKKAKSSKEHHEFISQHRKRVGLDSKVVDREAAKRKQGMERAADRVIGAREETEINELSKKTLGSYVKKAHKDARNRSEDITARNIDANNSHLSDWQASWRTRAIHKYNKEDSHKIKNRDKGINRAVGKLTK